jgi:protein TIF31
MVHKVMNDFGEASVVGAIAIFDGHVAPMNPNEPTRSHVYLHNNIFFSRAIDSGVETFKIATGDNCARKSASRDAQCMGALYRLDVAGLHTLATVLVDYLGTRFICQSIVPGILHGEKTHTLLYGAVEATSPLAWDKDMHELLESSIGRTFMIASRSVPTRPLTDERIAEVESLRSELPFLPTPERTKEDEAELPATRTVCGPIEAKGIQGSDQRKYVLDLTRLTPRDANWVPKSKGGTGKWETVLEENGTSNKRHLIPETLDDDELIMALLRPELVTLLTHKKMSEYMQGKKQEEEQSEKTGDETKRTELKDSSKEDTEVGKESVSDEAVVKVEGDSKDDKPEPKKRTLTPEDEEHLKSMRLNVNLFLPHIKPLIDIDDSMDKQLENDMERVCEFSSILWDVFLPRLTQEIREGTNQQLPNDGRSLTELLHQRGINCRYLGRLASLAAAEEEKDNAAVAAMKRGQMIPRRVMPLCWLEMLECEMVARSAKHVLDSYLTEHGGTAATQPAQTFASFLSALLSTSVESAGETEIRLRKEASAASVSMPDEDDFNALAIFNTGGDGDAVPAPIRGRKEVWDDIERDLGRRFRYSLSLYNQPGASTRALYVSLLRRVCQRTGVRLVAKNYTLGEKCLCNSGSTSGGRITASYPISVLDILEIVPLVKHSAAQGGEGFVPCSAGPNIILPSLHVLLPDAKGILDSATLHYHARALPLALDLAQEAANLYQRAVDSPMHSSILRCLDLSTAILFDAGETQLAVSNASRSLALSVQLGGFDNAETVACHSTMSHVLINSGKMAAGVKHIRACLYLMELMAGPRFAELSTMYHKLGTVYHSVQNPAAALRCYQEASGRHSSDRLVEGMVAKSTALVLGNFGQFKAAVELEKRAYQLYAALLGEDHDLTKNSHKTLENLTRLAVEQGSQQAAENKKRHEEEATKVITQREEEAANAIANQIEVEEEEEEKKKKKNKKKNKKKK